MIIDINYDLFFLFFFVFFKNPPDGNPLNDCLIEGDCCLDGCLIKGDCLLVGDAAAETKILGDLLTFLIYGVAIYLYTVECQI